MPPPLLLCAVISPCNTALPCFSQWPRLSSRRLLPLSLSHHDPCLISPAPTTKLHLTATRFFHLAGPCPHFTASHLPPLQFQASSVPTTCLPPFLFGFVSAARRPLFSALVASWSRNAGQGSGCCLAVERGCNQPPPCSTSSSPILAFYAASVPTLCLPLFSCHPASPSPPSSSFPVFLMYVLHLPSAAACRHAFPCPKLAALLLFMYACPLFLHCTCKLCWTEPSASHCLRKIWQRH
mmetsp:Transcript_2226/g.4122  ORF Transcript_2226/g.4122 Transcript_2226/m.4122 type:complete len:238 (-) Transcript_2226:51-764(-)